MRLDMQEELTEFITQYNLKPFNLAKSSLRLNPHKNCKTTDARIVYTKVIEDISKNFSFLETSNILQYLSLSVDKSEISKRQSFFKEINPNLKNDFLKMAKKERKSWRPKYSVIVVTEDEKEFIELQKRNCPVKLLLSDSDVTSLEDADIILVSSCDIYRFSVERLPQTIFLRNI